jgi:hypothetical protein
MLGRRRVVTSVAVLAFVTVLGAGCGGSRSTFSLPSGTFTVRWTDGSTTSSFRGTAGSTQFNGISGPSPSFASSFTFAASGHFDGDAFTASIKLTAGGTGLGSGTGYQITGKVGSMPVIGTARISTNFNTLKSHLVFGGKVGGTNVSGTLPLPPEHGQTNSSTGTIKVG